MADTTGGNGMTETTDRVGPLTRARASVAAVETLARIRREARTVATDGERVALSGWSGWGPLAPVFAPKDDSWADLNERLRAALPEADFKVGMQGTYNAFYTPAPVASAMWAMLRDFGYDSGSVAELGCGGGAFFGTAPQGTPLAGVERDPTAAAICSLLYPHAKVVHAELQNVKLGSGFAAVVGNVPYGKVQVFDPTAPAQVTSNLHNYFIWRAVQSLAPGGYAVLLTSRYTMDSGGTLSRAAIGKDADLVGALRLPNGALGGGTDVAADIVILRRKSKNGPRTYGHRWSDTVTSPKLGELQFNEFWDNEPGAVLGSMVKGTTAQYGLSLAVDGDSDPVRVADRALRYVRGDLVRQARDRNLMWQAPPRPDFLDVESMGVVSSEGWHEDSMHLTGDGGVLVVRDGRAQPLPVPKNPAASAAWMELLSLLRLRDLAVALVAAEADHSRTDRSIEPIRADTRAAYESYVKRFGALNRYRQKQDGFDPETDEPRYKRIYPRMSGFRHDPDSSLVFALEMYEDDDEGETDDDDEAGTAKARPAPILTDRQNRPRPRRDRAESVEQALAWCLDVKGRIDLDHIGWLLGQPVPAGGTDQDVEASREFIAGLLGDSAYLEPQTRQWLTAEEYLSDDVREKHKVAQHAAVADSRFQRNVDALAEVLPRWLGPAEITANLGTPWIGPDIVGRFIAETIGHEVSIRRVPAGNHWEIETNRILKSSVAATARWGTKDVDAFTLIEKALNNVVPVVYREIDDGEGGTITVKDKEASLLATEKQQELRAEFGEWVWRDAARADKLIHYYNTTFNNLVPRKFDGSHITIDGMAPWFQPYAHQLDMVARALATGATLCGLPVGSGKTNIMAMIAIKLKQLLLVDKPMIVVPNHLIEQVDREVRQLFPSARILTGASKTVSRNRRAFTARCATQQWDIVLVTHSAFNSMDVDPDTQRAYIEDLEAELYAGVVEGAGGEIRNGMVKRLAKQLDEMKAKILKLRDTVLGRDAGVRFEQLGVDYICVDEFHYYKNLAVPVRTDGFSVKPSKRAQDLDMKLRWLAGRGSGRYASLFSGTPVSNTMLELYVCMHYTMRPYLQKIGIGSPDAWAAAFVQFVTGVEVTVDGGDFRMHTRPSLFVNVPELRAILARVADTRTAEQLGLKRPKSELRVIAIDPTDAQAEYSLRLVDRAEKCRNQRGRVTKGADNMLKVCGDGRRMATDPLLVGIDDDGRYKLHVVADHIIQMWQAHPGELQIAFCDIGTPFDPKAREAAKRRKARKEAEERGDYGFGGFGSNDWGELGGDLASELAALAPAPGKRSPSEPVVLDYQTYGRLRRILVDAGMDVRRIRFIHDAKSDAEKAQLFRDCRRGKVDVILGSTDKLGVGTNIQHRVIALHHIDAPFRPADVEQRDGRGVRPKNRNKLVYIYRYVTKRTFDAYMWQMLHRKLTFISQMLSGEGLERTAADISGDEVMSFAAIKAAATDQPLLEEKVRVESDIKRLRNSERAHRSTLERARRDVPRMRGSADAAAADAELRERIGAYGKGVDLTDDLVEKLHEEMGRASKYSPPRIRIAAGLAVEWCERLVEAADGGLPDRQPTLHLVVSVDGKTVGFQKEEAYRFWKPGQVARRIRKMIDGAGEAAAKIRAVESRYRSEADQLESLAGQPFEQAGALTTACARLDQINAELREAAVKAGSRPGVESASCAPEPAAAADPMGSVDMDALDRFFENPPDDFAEFQDEVDAQLAADLQSLML